MKISIIVPCYNAEAFIEACLSSCIAQTYKNLEIVFVDNESTDKSLELAKPICDKNGINVYTAPNKFKYSWEEPVLEALKHISGDYFTIVGADDILHPNYIQNVVNELISLNNPKCIQSGLFRFLPTGEVYQEIYKYANLDEFKNLLFKSCVVLTPTVFYSKSLYDEGHMSWNSEQYMGASDYDLYFQFANKRIFITPVQKFLGYYYRMHKDQSTWGMVQQSLEGNSADHKIKEYWRSLWKI